MVPLLSPIVNIAQKLILERFSPAAVLINSKHEVLYFSGPTDEFLVRPQGVPTLNLPEMVREGLRSGLRMALREAANSDRTTASINMQMRHDTDCVPVQVTITPTSGGDLGELFLVVFCYTQQPALIANDQNTDWSLVHQLEEELDATRNDLRNTTDCFEAANESLKASNEEIISINEELRALNEELESSKEELQSLNEELTVANQQLETKLSELKISNVDLANFLDSSDIATICLDKLFCIKWFTPAAQKQFNLVISDIGRLISDFTQTFGDENLIGAAEMALARQAVALYEFQTRNKHWYIRRVLPYKNRNDQISGVIVTYTDITESHLIIEVMRREISELYERRVHECTDKLHALFSALAMAEERERRTLAQHLHDDLGQMLAVIKLKVTGLEKLKIPSSLPKALHECITVIDQTNQKLHAMVFHLNPPLLYETGLVPALGCITEEMRQNYKLNIRIDDEGGLKPMDPAVNATLFRVIQELLINIAKHARVENATVTLARDDQASKLIVTVSDAGVGFDPNALPTVRRDSGFGLFSVRERLGFLGGDVTIHSHPGQGTSVILRVPLLRDENIDSKLKQGGGQ
ncbi:Oxygen sensor histidine kinase NreB (modular protein) [Gammaproteobacteria bacterium]